MLSPQGVAVLYSAADTPREKGLGGSRRGREERANGRASVAVWGVEEWDVGG